MRRCLIMVALVAFLALIAVPSFAQENPSFYSFEVIRDGYAWGPTLDGYYIDLEGRVFEFENSENFSMNEGIGDLGEINNTSRTMTIADLDEKHGSGRKETGRISREDLTSLTALINKAKTGENPSIPVVGEDIIYTEFYMRELKTGSEQEILSTLLAISFGDAISIRNNPEARQIVDFLLKLKKR